ncbi:MAG: tRNA-specific 2-thiouridylase MnmA [candidate division TM6 bacterium GW2011_GWE2_41_16]|nr:MAG: tRNA-specific 2-thiouridylase MnmA [candidate division TM6 bacterium GW2011_GWE2_41_16]
MRIAVLVSGGVDSTVALRQLCAEGHDVVAFYLKIWLEDETSFLGSCPWEEDLQYVRAVCAQVEVPLEIIPFQKEYYEQVVAYTIFEVKAGRTPNPDMLCNRAIKFGAFFDAVSASFDAVASGHYAQTVRICSQEHGERTLAERTLLAVSPDEVKDQTYFLARVPRERIARLVFPIGRFTKQQVRMLAQMYDVPNKDRKDSQGICFLGSIKFSEFIRFHVGERSGSLVEWESKKKVGEHKGFWFYTLGQRQGIGLSGGPWYVVAKDSARNIVYVSKEYSLLAQDRTTLDVESMNWLVDQSMVDALEGQSVQIKLRHGPHYNTAVFNKKNNGCMHIVLERPDQGLAAGQIAVLYHQGFCLGGGVISESAAE